MPTVEIMHIMSRSVESLPLIEVTDDYISLDWGFGVGQGGMRFDRKTGGGIGNDSAWMITDRGMSCLDLERHAYPKPYLQHCYALSVFSGSVAHEPALRKGRDNVHPKQIPMFEKK